MAHMQRIFTSSRWRYGVCCALAFILLAARVPSAIRAAPPAEPQGELKPLPDETITVSGQAAADVKSGASKRVEVGRLKIGDVTQVEYRDVKSIGSESRQGADLVLKVVVGTP